MTMPETVENAVESGARDIARSRAARLRERVEPPVDQFKEETAERVENLAEQVRHLGRQLDRRDEAHVVARRLERTADYLRYRPSAEVAADAWQVVRRSRARVGRVPPDQADERLTRGRSAPAPLAVTVVPEVSSRPAEPGRLVGGPRGSRGPPR
jgi:hypothetical protein